MPAGPPNPRSEPFAPRGRGVEALQGWLHGQTMHGGHSRPQSSKQLSPGLQYPSPHVEPQSSQQLAVFSPVSHELLPQWGPVSTRTEAFGGLVLVP